MTINALNTIRLSSFPANSLVGNNTGSSAAIAAIPTSLFLPTGGFQAKYVSQDGDDTNGDGTVLHPYATVSKAMSVITTASATQPYAINVSGRIVESGDLTLKPNVSIFSFNAQISIVGTLLYDAQFLTVTSVQYYDKIRFSLGTQPNWDFSSAAPASHSTTMYFSQVTGITSFTMLGSVQETLLFYNCFNSNNPTISLTNLSNGYMYSSSFTSLLIQNTTASFVRFQLNSLMNFGSLTIKSTSGLLLVLARAINNSTGITLDGNVSFDIDTIEAVPTLLNGAAYVPATRLESIKGTSAGGIPYSTASTMLLLAGTATANKPLLSGNLAAPSWAPFALSMGGNITTGGAFTMSGAFTFTGTLTANTAITYPTSGTLATTSQLPTASALTKTDDTNVTLTLGGSPSTALLAATSLTLGWTGQLGLTRGGTGASLTASNGGVVYSTGSALAILSGTATANQMLVSGLSTTPSWTTNTWPLTAANNSILYASAANTISALSSANSGVLITSNVGVPSISTTIPLITQRNITELNNITATFTLGGQLRTFCPAAGNIGNLTSASGTFTPGIAFGGNAVGVTFSSQTGRYALTTLPDGSIRCDCWIQMSLSNKGSSTGVFTFTNLPLTSGTAGVFVFDVATENVSTTSGAQIFGVVNNSALTANFYYYTNASTAAQLSNANIANNSTFRCYISYWNTN